MFVYTSNAYKIQEIKNTKYTDDTAGVCYAISALRPTHIRDHSPFTQRLNRGGEGKVRKIAKLVTKIQIKVK